MEYFAYSQRAFVYKYVVMLSDTDQFKHMSFGNYLKLMFLATDAMLVNFLNEPFLAEYRLKLLNTRMQFKKQTCTGDNILIKVNSSEMNDKGFAFLHTFVIEGSAELVGLGRQSYELVGLNQNRTVPEGIFEKIRNLLNPIRVDERFLVYKY